MCTLQTVIDALAQLEPKISEAKFEKILCLEYSFPRTWTFY